MQAYGVLYVASSTPTSPRDLLTFFFLYSVNSSFTLTTVEKKIQRSGAKKTMALLSLAPCPSSCRHSSPASLPHPLPLSFLCDCGVHEYAHFDLCSCHLLRVFFWYFCFRVLRRQRKKKAAFLACSACLCTSLS